MFGDWAGLLVDGLKVLVVGLMYGLAPVVLVVAVTASGGVVSRGGLGLRTAAPFTLVGIGAAILLALFVGYVLPTALVNLAVERDLGAAFDVETVLELVRTGPYLTAWLLALGVGVLTLVVAAALQIAVVGIVAVPFVSFYANVAVFYLFARAYREVLGAPAERASA